MYSVSYIGEFTTFACLTPDSQEDAPCQALPWESIARQFKEKIQGCSPILLGKMKHPNWLQGIEPITAQSEKGTFKTVLKISRSNIWSPQRPSERNGRSHKLPIWLPSPALPVEESVIPIYVSMWELQIGWRRQRWQPRLQSVYLSVFFVIFSVF